MKDTTNTLEGIRDIAPPTVPWQYAWESFFFSDSAPGIIVVGLIATGLLLVILHFIWQRFFSLRGKARRQITVLQQQHNSQNIDSHYAAFQLSHILRETLNIVQLSTHTPLPEKLQAHKERWQFFNESLSVARYSLVESSPEENTPIANLLIDAHFWLRYWPKKNNA
jgi:hypothetical protein